MNTTTNLSSSGMKTEFIRYMKCDSPVVNPNYMTRYSKRPYLVVKAVLGISLARTLIWWEPERRSILENTWTPTSWSNRMSMHGSNTCSWQRPHRAGGNPRIDAALCLSSPQTTLNRPKVMYLDGYSLCQASLAVESSTISIPQATFHMRHLIPGCNSILNSIALSGGIPGRSSGNMSRNSQITWISSSFSSATWYKDALMREIVGRWRMTLPCTSESRWTNRPAMSKTALCSFIQLIPKMTSSPW
jgi:hypothetical protein